MPLAPKSKKLKSGDYDHYPLYTGLHATAWFASGYEDPPLNVRLDDFNVATLLISRPTSTLGEKWPCEFDNKGMPRAMREPIGNPFKLVVKTGDLDVNGYKAKIADQGWYFGLWKGLHPLLGQEGKDAGLWKIRPSYEKPKCETFGWRKDLKCPLQFPPGHVQAAGPQGTTIAAGIQTQTPVTADMVKDIMKEAMKSSGDAFIVAMEQSTDAFLDAITTLKRGD